MKTITYSEMVKGAKLILCNNIREADEMLFDNVYSGDLYYCYIDEDDFENDEDLKETYESYDELLESHDYDKMFDIYQYYIIDDYSAKYLARYTNEIIFYSDLLDVYVLGVTHFGTPWNGVNVEVSDNFVISK